MSVGGEAFAGITRRSPALHALLLSLALTAAFCAVAAAKMWPLIDGDGPAYFPPVIEWSVGRPLTNPLWLAPLDDSIDGPGGRRYIYHGFLYALVVGGMARQLGGGARPSVAAAYVIHWLVACAGTLALLSWATVRGRARVVLAGLAPVALLACSVAWHGRVEPLALLIIAAGCSCWHVLPHPWREAAAGAGTSLLFFTSPACGVLGVCVVAVALIASDDRFPLWRGASAAIAGATLGGAAAVWLYPYPILDWMAGVIRHGRMNLALPAGRGFSATWLTRPELPLLIVSLALLLAGAVSRLVDLERHRSTSHRIAVSLASALFAVGLARLAFLKTEASYNAVVWMPLLACVTLSGQARWHVCAVIGVLVFPAIGLVRSSVVLAQQFRQQTVTFRDAQEKIHELAPLGCSVSSGLWMAAWGFEGVTTSDGPGTSRRFFVRQQTNMGQARPPSVPGYRLLDDRFGGGTTVLGLPLTRTPGGWNFAVYESVPVVRDRSD
jgi:hypothetical protein